MKNILFVMLFFVLKINAQIIDFPDSNFKFRLIHGNYPNTHGFDTNHDGEIDMQEAAAITTLNFSSPNIHDLTGVRNFVNLRTLKVPNCGIYIFDLHDMVNLVTFDCNYNYNLTTSIDVSGCSSLVTLTCSANPITSINLSGAVSLQSFNSSYNALSTIDFSGLSQLKTINISYGQIESVNLIGVINLENFNAYKNKITSLSLSNRPNLVIVSCSNNKIRNLDLNNNSSLITVDCSGNLIENLTIEGSDNIQTFKCNYNNLSSLVVNNLKKVREFNCSKNKIESLDLSNWDDVFPRSINCSENKLTSLALTNTNVAYLECGENNFTTLDLSNRSKLIKLECQNTPLTYLNITNQADSPLMDSTNNRNISLAGNYSLFFICADYWQVGKYQNYLNQIGLRAKVGDNCNIEATVSPNPARDYIEINAIENITAVYLYDLQGKLLVVNTTSIQNNTCVIDMSNYSFGTYLLKIETKSGTYNYPKKIIKF